MSSPKDILIVGAGLAGLSCARRLRELGVPAVLLEAGDDVGGRARTDRVDGFLLDRGFHVFLPAYPEARSVLDYAALDLRFWRRGAAVWADGAFHRVSDPGDGTVRALANLFSPAMQSSDALPLARMRQELGDADADAWWGATERSAEAELVARGFSDRLIHRLFRPFYGAVFFDRGLETSNRMMLFAHAMLTRGGAAIPARGIGSIAHQLAGRLDGQRVRLGARVTAVDPGGAFLRLASGEELAASAIVLATEGDTAHHLAGAASGDRAFPGWRGTQTFYFSAREAPVADAVIVLDGDGTGPVNHFAVPSNVAPAVAPAGQHLIAASTVGTEATESAVREQLGEWFGTRAVRSWRHLRTYDLPHALPVQVTMEPPRRAVRMTAGLYICGDHRDNASIDGALQSGRRAAEAVFGDLGRGGARSRTPS